MSLKSGTQSRRALAIVGSACFLAGLAISATPADAGIYLSLKPVGATAGSSVGQFSGTAFTGYTLTLAAGSAASIQYDVVVNITDGATTSQSFAGGTTQGLYLVRGAVRGAGSAGLTASHSSYTYTNATNPISNGLTSAAFRLDPGGALTGANAMRAETFDGLRPGTAAPARRTLIDQVSGPQTAPDIAGAGPQFGIFSNSDSQVATNNSGIDRFEVFYNNSASSIPGTVLTPQVLIGSVDLTVARAEGVSLSAGTAGQTATFTWVGGAGVDFRGTSSSSAWAQWYENVGANRAGVQSTHSNANSFSLPLTVVFAAAGPAIVKGDFGGNLTPTGIDPSLDGTSFVPDGAISGLDADAGLLFYSAPDVYALINPAVGSYTLAEQLALADFGGTATPLGIDPSLDGTFFKPDGAISGLDVDAFLLFLSAPDVYELIQATPRGPGLTSIPEPMALGLLAPLGLAMARRRR
jgi:hypothetical protein